MPGGTQAFAERFQPRRRWIERARGSMGMDRHVHFPGTQALVADRDPTRRQAPSRFAHAIAVAELDARIQAGLRADEAIAAQFVFETVARRGQQSRRRAAHGGIARREGARRAQVVEGAFARRSQQVAARLGGSGGGQQLAHALRTVARRTARHLQARLALPRLLEVALRLRQCRKLRRQRARRGDGAFGFGEAEIGGKALATLCIQQRHLLQSRLRHVVVGIDGQCIAITRGRGFQLPATQCPRGLLPASVGGACERGARIGQSDMTWVVLAGELRPSLPLAPARRA